MIVWDRESYGETAVSRDLARAESLDDLAARLRAYECDLQALLRDGEIEAAGSLRRALMTRDLPVWGDVPSCASDDHLMSWDGERGLYWEPGPRQWEIGFLEDTSCSE